MTKNQTILLDSIAENVKTFEVLKEHDSLRVVVNIDGVIYKWIDGKFVKNEPEKELRGGFAGVRPA